MAANVTTVEKTGTYIFTWTFDTTVTHDPFDGDGIPNFEIYSTETTSYILPTAVFQLNSTQFEMTYGNDTECFEAWRIQSGQETEAIDPSTPVAAPQSGSITCPGSSSSSRSSSSSSESSSSSSSSSSSKTPSSSSSSSASGTCAFDNAREECATYKTMRLLPYHDEQNDILMWRGVDCSGTYRLLHHTYREISRDDDAPNDRANELKTLGGSILDEGVAGDTRGQLYRDDSDGLRARALTWCPACADTCITGCTGGEITGARDDITVAGKLLVTFTDAGGGCCNTDPPLAYNICMCTGGDCGSPNGFATYCGICPDDQGNYEDCTPCLSGWSCTNMASWLGETAGTINSECPLDYPDLPQAMPFNSITEVKSYCCYKTIDAITYCVRYVTVRVYLFVNTSTIWSPPDTPEGGCCTYQHGAENDCFCYAGCAIIGASSECGAFGDGLSVTLTCCDNSGCDITVTLTADNT